MLPTVQAQTNGLVIKTRRTPVGGRPPNDVTADRVSPLHHGDRLDVLIENTGPAAVDVTVLFADANYGIGCLYPNKAGESNRIEPGATKVVDDIRISADETRGWERLIVISVGARRSAERADFSFLQQRTLPVSRGDVAPSEDVLPFLDAGFADYQSRGALLPAIPTSATAMQVYNFKVQP